MFVIPAKAGIQFVKCSSKKRKNFLDPGLRRDDETKENEGSTSVFRIKGLPFFYRQRFCLLDGWISAFAGRIINNKGVGHGRSIHRWEF